MSKSPEKLTLSIVTYLLESAQTIQHLVLRKDQMDSPILGVNGFQMKNISQMSVKMADHAVTPGKEIWEATKRRIKEENLGHVPILQSNATGTWVKGHCLHLSHIPRPMDQLLLVGSAHTQCHLFLTRRERQVDKVHGSGRPPFRLPFNESELLKISFQSLSFN